MADALAPACAWAVAGILLLAAAHKARNFLAFRAVLHEYRLLPEMAVPIAAAAIITAEVAAGLALLMPATALPPANAALPAALLLCLYSSAIAVNLLRGRTAIDCGCGGEATPLSGWLLLRNGLLLALVFVAATSASGLESPASQLLLTLAVALFLWCAYAIGNQLLANSGRARLAGISKQAVH